MADRRNPSLQFLVRLVAVGFGALLAAPASAQPELSEAFRGWFVTDPAVTCVDRNGRDRPCSISASEHIGVHRDPSDTMALVFITYLPDPTAIGDAVRIAAAAFRKDDRGWHLVQAIPGAHGEPTGRVTFRDGSAIYAVAVPEPGDPRCCPSGSEVVRIDLE